MNQTVTEAGHYFEKFKVKAREDVDLVFIPPFTDIPVAKFFISRSSIGLGAQNMYPGGKRSFYRRDFTSYAQGSWMHVCHLRTF